MKSYEILPAGMTGGAMDGGRGVKTPKPYEILPAAGTAEQGLGGWTKEAAAIAQGMTMYGGFGLPYDPAGAVPSHGGATASGMGKQPKTYGIGAAGPSAQGSGAKGGGCGCGGSCGEQTSSASAGLPGVGGLSGFSADLARIPEPLRVFVTDDMIKQASFLSSIGSIDPSKLIALSSERLSPPNIPMGSGYLGDAGEPSPRGSGCADARRYFDVARWARDNVLDRTPLARDAFAFYQRSCGAGRWDLVCNAPGDAYVATCNDNSNSADCGGAYTAWQSCLMNPPSVGVRGCLAAVRAGFGEAAAQAVEAALELERRASEIERACPRGRQEEVPTGPATMSPGCWANVGLGIVAALIGVLLGEPYFVAAGVLYALGIFIGCEIGPYIY